MAEKATQEKKSVSHFWARESGSLYLFGDGRKVRFDDYFVTLDLSDPLHKEVDKFLRTHRSFNVDYYEVITQKNNRDEQKAMVSLIRKLLNPNADGEIDGVAKVNGVKKLTAMFTDEELAKLETYRNNPDIDLLTIEASQNKYIQGVE